MLQKARGAAVVALMALPYCACFAFSPAQNLVHGSNARTMSLRCPSRPRRSLVVTAALSDDQIKPSDAYKAASPDIRKETDEMAMEAVTEQGRQELKSLADLTKQEQEVLKKKLEEVRICAACNPCFPQFPSCQPRVNSSYIFVLYKCCHCLSRRSRWR